MKSKAVGIIAVKNNSNRFPGKNLHPIDEIPMFWYSVKPLLEAENVMAVYVATDSEYVRDYCEERNVGIIWRGANAINDEEPLLGVLRYAYKSLNAAYEYIVTIMANCPFHSADSVDEGLDLISQQGLREIRSFNSSKEESGLMIFSEDVILNNTEISSHIGFLSTEVEEVHYKEDLANILESRKSNQ